ncbi:MAG: MerR family transcriptional regulator [Clostridium sp.]|uniref:MerR family transcriptional regulator n=1 Tax=Clostridium sp. DSM 8431 TaxID=1761781 RepID=UPI0008DF7F2F|nr:MerR family transcriptional regulator [Clostridium sp. DSM 8431]MCR4944703.1 MerR family transcriptional regulator [Clostridium sp.]SFU72816.1 DNA-binding transcriptional regulator, MerR family [Clostridium sp. DSM 8431]
MTISEVSKKYELTADTLRYYERIGLIPAVPRNSSGVRDYGEEECNWVNFIKCMRNAGLSIEALVEYVALFQKGDSTIQARHNILEEQRELLIDRINDMQATLLRLDEKIRIYDEQMRECENMVKK